MTKTEGLSPAHSRLWDRAIQILENNKGGYSEDVEPLPAPPEAIVVLPDEHQDDKRLVWDGQLARVE